MTFELGSSHCGKDKFAHSEWKDFLGPPKVTRFVRLDEDQYIAGRRLGGKLRHGLGKARVPGSQKDPTLCDGLKCDEGYWVNLPDAFKYAYIWDRLGAQFNLRTHSRKEELEVFHRKLGLIMLCNQNEMDYRNRLRYHILGLKIKVSKLLQKPGFMTRHGMDLDSERWANRHEDSYIWLMPLAIRCTMGQSPREGGIVVESRRTHH